MLQSIISQKKNNSHSLIWNKYCWLKVMNILGTLFKNNIIEDNRLFKKNLNFLQNST